MKKRPENTGDRVRGRKMIMAVIIVTAMSFSACAIPFGGSGDGRGTEESSEPSRADTGFILTGPDSYDSADTAVLTGRNGKENTVTFLNLDLGREYTLSMDGTTGLYNKYGEAVSLQQIETGDIVDITFLKSKKHLTSMSLSSSSWSYENVVQYEIDAVRGEVTIGEEIYQISSDIRYLSEGRSIEQEELNPADVLTFQGIGNRVLSVRVEKGHGYLRLTNDEHFVGGWIEIGQSMIRRITEDMLLTVPEGTWQVSISNQGGGGVKTAEIRRNEETVVDIGDLEVPEPQSGIVLFSLSPSNTELYIDGSRADTSGPVTLEYGLHQLIARADGYQSVSRYIRVAQESASIDVVLEAVETGEEDTGSSTSSGSSDTDVVTDYYKVYVDAPEGAEIYLDGSYVGISPCSFKKASGTRIITLRKSGYETRSYTVQIDSEDKDVTYSFADLVPFVPDGQTNTGSSNTSGSANTSGGS